ncbi:pyridoxamine 5'-phosphate oxidase family protein [Streptomyces sp. NPDC002206]
MLQVDGEALGHVAGAGVHAAGHRGCGDAAAPRQHLLHRYIATSIQRCPTARPQLTQTWVDTDGEHVLINSVESHQKTRNIARDPRVAVTIADPSAPASYVQIRGRVVRVTAEGAVDHIEALAQKYLGGPYPWFGGRDQVRVIYVIQPERISSPRG